MAGRRRRSVRGTTLVEALITLCILGLILAGLGKVLASGYFSSETVSDQNRMQQEAQHLADQIVDSLRGATAFIGGSAGHVRASFKNGDMLGYQRVHNQLRRVKTSGGVYTTEVLSDHLLAMTLTFYHPEGSEWQPTLAATTARGLQVSLTVASGRERATETSAVKLRNEP